MTPCAALAANVVVDAGVALVAHVRSMVELATIGKDDAASVRTTVAVPDETLFGDKMLGLFAAHAVAEVHVTSKHVETDVGAQMMAAVGYRLAAFLHPRIAVFPLVGVI